MTSRLLPIDVRDLYMRLKGGVTSALERMIPAFIADRFLHNNLPNNTPNSSAPDPYASHVDLMHPPPAYFLNVSSVSLLPLYSRGGAPPPPYGDDIELNPLPAALPERQRYSVFPGFVRHPTAPPRSADRNAWSFPEKYRKPLLVVLCLAAFAGGVALSMLIPKMKPHETLPHPPPPPQGSATPPQSF